LYCTYGRECNRRTIKFPDDDDDDDDYCSHNMA